MGGNALSDDNNGNGILPSGGSEDPNRFGNPERGFGKLANLSFHITEDNVNKIEQHLSRPLLVGDNGLIAPENARMIERLRIALTEERPITGADASFYFHELYEVELMDNAGIDYNTAHRMAFDFYNVADFTVYHPDVIREFSGIFGPLWKKFWGIGGQ